MNIFFKITDALLSHTILDLSRPHAFAAERVGFLACKVGRVGEDGWILLASTYHPIEDDDYVNDYSVGARIGPAAIRKALQYAYSQPVSIAHVHIHDHVGVPRFSRIDTKESARLIPDFWNVRPRLPHSALVFSKDSIMGYTWEPTLRNRVPISDFTIVGSPMRLIRAAYE